MSKSTSAHPTGGALISAGTLTSAPLTESISAHSHVDMSALLLKLQTEREKREALEHEVDIIKRRLEERSVVQSAADYKQTLFSEMLHVQLSGADPACYNNWGLYRNTCACAGSRRGRG